MLRSSRSERRGGVALCIHDLAAKRLAASEDEALTHGASVHFYLAGETFIDAINHRELVSARAQRAELEQAASHGYGAASCAE